MVRIAMSRSGYIDDDYDQWATIKWRGQVASAIRGKRGQAFLRELIDALDALPEKRLIRNELHAPVIIVNSDGVAYKKDEVCAIGSVGIKRGVRMDRLEVEDYDSIAATFGIAHQLVQEIEYENDLWQYSNEERWRHVREWAVSKLR
jgi:hypothetical protein